MLQQIDDMKFIVIIWILTLTSLSHVTDAGDCFTDFGEEYSKCLIGGRFKAANYSECCSYPSASGYVESTSWIIFPEYLFNRKKAQTSCQSCADYMNEGGSKNWCFGYRNNADNYCVHSAPSFEILNANDELDCCLWYNASGFTDSPNWRWSKSYGRWTTLCNECYKDDLVGCYEGLSEINSELVCDSPQSRMSRSTNECCNRRNAVAYDLMDRYGNGKRQCFPCPIHGKWSPWSVWSPCSTTCGSGQKRKIRICNNPIPQFGGKECNGYGEEIANCTNNVQCADSGIQNRNMIDTQNLSNNTDMFWSDWSAFSQCGVTCGIGTKMRQRICLLSPFEYNNCNGSDRDVQPCESARCPKSNNTHEAKEFRIDDRNFSWGPWSPCPQTCGVGIRKRITMCTVPNNDDNNNGTNVTSTTPTKNFDSNGGCVESTEVGLCELQACVSEVSMDPGVPIAWTVAVLAMGTLITGSVILFCQRRRWDEKMKSYFKRPSLDTEHKPRTPAELPPVPEVTTTASSLTSFRSIEDLRNRYATDTNRRSSRGAVCQQDDEGYEIPRQGVNESTAEDKGAISGSSGIHSKNPPDNWGSDGSNLHVNHVYEQLEFSADGTKISIAEQGDSVV